MQEAIRPTATLLHLFNAKTPERDLDHRNRRWSFWEEGTTGENDTNIPSFKANKLHVFKLKMIVQVSDRI